MTNDLTIQAQTDIAPTTTSVDILRIMEMIPHRYPLLLIDKVIGIEKDVRAVGIKNVTFNEPHFTGHFP